MPGPGLLRYMSRDAESFRAAAAALDVVAVQSAGPGSIRWGKPAGVIAPLWEETGPPFLAPDSRPILDGPAAEFRSVWDLWCRAEDLTGVVRRVVAQFPAGEASKFKAHATVLLAWLDTLASDDRRRHAVKGALAQVPWVPATKGNESKLALPGDVVLHASSAILRRRFLVPIVALPKSLADLGLSFRQLQPSAQTLEAIADALVEAGAKADAQDVLALYRLVRDWAKEDEALATCWRAAARAKNVYRLFRSPERLVPGDRLFLGSKEDGDVGEVLFALRFGSTAASPVGVYKALGVPESPTRLQVLLALGTGPLVPKHHERLVELLDKCGDESFGPEEIEAAKKVRVRSCAGSFESVERCYLDEDLDREDRVAKEGAARVIARRSRSTARLLEILEAQAPGAVRRLEAVATPQVIPGPAVTLSGPTRDFFAPWLDVLRLLNDEHSRLAAELATLTGRPSDAGYQLEVVAHIGLRFAIGPDVVESHAKWSGPDTFRDGKRVLVAGAALERAGAKSGDATTLVDREIAGRMAAAVEAPTGLDSDLTRRDRLAARIVAELERPGPVLAKLAGTWRASQIERFHTHSVHGEFEARYRQWKDTSQKSARAQELERELLRIVEAEAVKERAETIRGYGYDPESVFGELVQNAEDARRQWDDLGMMREGPPLVSFRYRREPEGPPEAGRVTLTVEHFGRTFNLWRTGAKAIDAFRNDVEGLLRDKGSFKPLAPAEGASRPVGKFGLGFKSVYLICDRPRVHSGQWHFAIEACCIPVQLAAPNDLPQGATRFVLPLREPDSAVEDPRGEKLRNLVPFLREIEELRLTSSRGQDTVLEVRAEVLCEENGTRTELVRIVRTGGQPEATVDLLRVRDAGQGGEAQLGIHIDGDGDPAPWKTAFQRDVYSILPLRHALACGVACSHRFCVQAGRTHLIDPEANRHLHGEIAKLLRAVPSALRALAERRKKPLGEVLARFWAMWRWDRGDEEVRDLGTALARELTQLARTTPVAPTLDPRTCVALDGRLLFRVRLPGELVEKLMADAKVTFAPPGRKAQPLQRMTVLQPGALDAYERATARAAPGDRAGEQPWVEVDWADLGKALRGTDRLAANPELLSAIAAGLENRDLSKARLDEIHEWLGTCLVLVAGARAARDVPRNLVAFSFPNSRHLPLGRLRRLSERYDARSVGLLRKVGLRAAPGAGDLERLLGSALSHDECKGLVRYLAAGHWKDRGIYDLGARWRIQSWFVGPRGDRMTIARAFQAHLLDDVPELQDDPTLQAWFGVETGVAAPPPLPAPPPRPLDPGAILERIHEWWGKTRASAIDDYEGATYPDRRRPDVDRLREGDVERDTAVRRDWMTLFLLGAFHRMGRTRPEQHRNFIETCERQGWMDIFVNPDLRADDWMGILERYLDERDDRLDYHQWVSYFVTIYQFARWLPQYAEIFRGAERVREAVAIDQFLVPRRSALYDRSDVGDAPPLERTLGLGACFVFRELVRFGALRSERIHGLCYVPRGAVRRLLEAMQCPALPAAAAATHQVHKFLRQHLGERATFQSDFDLPFFMLAYRPRYKAQLDILFDGSAPLGDGSDWDEDL